MCVVRTGDLVRPQSSVQLMNSVLKKDCVCVYIFSVFSLQGFLDSAKRNICQFLI